LEHKAHGAPIQCAKGKCSKALHVTCAEQGKANATFRIVQIQETEVLIALDAAAALPTASTSGLDNEADPTSLVCANGVLMDRGTHRVLKTIQKYAVEVLCGLHNPVRTITNIGSSYLITSLHRHLCKPSVMRRLKNFTKYY
jgi:hypothetical protein